MSRQEDKRKRELCIKALHAIDEAGLALTDLADGRDLILKSELSSIARSLAAVTDKHFKQLDEPRVGWRYQARKRTEDGETWFELVEVFDGGVSWTENPVTVIADSKQELADWLRRAAVDVERQDALEG